MLIHALQNLALQNHVLQNHVLLIHALLIHVLLSMSSHPCDNCDDEYYNKNTLVLSRLEKLLIEINNVNNDDDCNNIYDDYLDYDENCYTNFIIVKPKKCEKNNNIPDQKNKNTNKKT